MFRTPTNIIFAALVVFALVMYFCERSVSANPVQSVSNRIKRAF